MLTFFCQRCGTMKRRERAESVMCCEREMILLRRAQLEAATKLTRPERALWAQRGMHIFRRPGRRWMPALTPGEIRRAKEQVTAHQAMLGK